MLPHGRIPEGLSTRTTLVLVIGGRLERAALSQLCGRARALATETQAALTVCDLGRAEADAVTVEAIARLKLELERDGGRAVFVHGSPELGDLLSFMGLDDVVDLTVQPQG